ncbi:MAG TPA: DnaJ domain-containing protein, partial [Anaerolineales bacterium]
MGSKQSDFYESLGLPRDATQEEIRRAYHEAAQRLHPDKNQAPGETEMFLNVQQAYEVLSNPARRAQYDLTLPPQEESSSQVLYEVHFSRPNLVWLTEPQMIYLLLQVSPRAREDEIPAPPLNVSLVLDRSTSMQGEKMDVVKSAAIQLLRSLRDNDILSVVTFSDRAEVVIPSTSFGD